ncbi:MAG: PD40 domain-containing protein [Chloroflexi bacterium]|nr:PD40 domain-containing protein [Chloroflexota bacterium]
MNKTSKVKGTLEVLFVIGLILLIPLFFAIKSVANAPAAQGTGTPYARATATSVPQSKPAISSSSPIQTNAKQPPQCTFPLAQTTTTVSAPENYTFSEPQVVSPSNATANDGITEIIDWLPNNQQVLLAQSVPDTNENKQNIELFNPQTGETQVYATRVQMNEPPIWIAGLNAVIYGETKVLKSTQKSGLEVPPYEFERQLWISRGDPKNAQLLKDTHLTADSLSDFSIATQPGGSEIVYLTNEDKQLSKKNTLSTGETPVAFDPAQWNYRGALRPQYLMAWRPGTSQIFFYTYGVGNMGYTFLVDADTGSVCELNFGGWAFFARWSPDGRYLAIVRNQEPSLPANSTDLAVLDTVTGKLYTMKVVSQEQVGRHYVADIAWAPDNYHLLVIGGVLSFPGCAPNCKEDTRLYLVDFIAGKVDDLLPSNQFIANNSGTNLAWSLDGTKVLTLCPVDLCFISVQRNGQ